MKHLGGPDDDHYAALGVQPLEATEAWSVNWPRAIAYHLGESVAMIARVGTSKRSDPVRDLRKAAFLLGRAADIIEAATDDVPERNPHITEAQREQLLRDYDRPPPEPFEHEFATRSTVVEPVTVEGETPSMWSGWRDTCMGHDLEPAMHDAANCERCREWRARKEARGHAAKGDRMTHDLEHGARRRQEGGSAEDE